jgi:hypothetical protein
VASQTPVIIRIGLLHDPLWGRQKGAGAPHKCGCAFNLLRFANTFASLRKRKALAFCDESFVL